MTMILRYAALRSGDAEVAELSVLALWFPWEAIVGGKENGGA